MLKITLKIFLVISTACTFCFSQSLSDIKIGIVHSELTKKLIYPGDKSFYPIQDWELFFLSRKISYSVVSDEDLNNNGFIELDVLIFPSVEVLSVDGANNLREFLKAGKGILVFGKLGVYGIDGRRNKSDFLLNNAGIVVDEHDFGNNISETITLNSNSLLCKRENFAENVLIMNQYSPLYAKSISTDVQGCGIYNTSDDNSAIVLSEKSGGRIAWFGFQLSQVGTENKAGSIIERLIFNSIEWLSPKPFVMLNKWPGSYKFSALMDVVIIDPKTVTEQVLNSFHSVAVPINFFLETSTIEADDRLLSGLSKSEEINLFCNINYSISAKYYSNLGLIYDKLSKTTKQDHFGIKINNSYSNELPDEIIKSQFDFYLLGDKKIVLADPDHSKDKLRILPLHPYYLLISGKDENSILDTASSLIESAAQKSEPLVLGIFDQSMVGSSLKSLDYLNSVIENLINKGAWITTYSDLINWTLNRENITIETSQGTNANLFEINIENRNQNDVKDIAISIFPPSGKKNPKTVQKDLNLIRNEGSNGYSLNIPQIKAGIKEFIIIRFE